MVVVHSCWSRILSQMGLLSLSDLFFFCEERDEVFLWHPGWLNSTKIIEVENGISFFGKNHPNWGTGSLKLMEKIFDDVKFLRIFLRRLNVLPVASQLGCGTDRSTGSVSRLHIIITTTTTIISVIITIKAECPAVPIGPGTDRSTRSGSRLCKQCPVINLPQMSNQLGKKILIWESKILAFLGCHHPSLMLFMEILFGNQLSPNAGKRP